MKSVILILFTLFILSCKKDKIVTPTTIIDNDTSIVSKKSLDSLKGIIIPRIISTKWIDSSGKYWCEIETDSVVTYNNFKNPAYYKGIWSFEMQQKNVLYKYPHLLIPINNSLPSIQFWLEGNELKCNYRYGSWIFTLKKQ